MFVWICKKEKKQLNVSQNEIIMQKYTNILLNTNLHVQLVTK